MRALRSTMWSPDLEPTTAVVLESDLRVSVEEAAQQLPGEGMFVINDIFETDDDLVQAVVQGQRRALQNRQDESNMALTYYWTLDRLPLLTNQGVIAMKDPAPLSADQLKVVLKQIAKHPEYNKHQSILFLASDGSLVTMRDGSLSGDA